MRADDVPMTVTEQQRMSMEAIGVQMGLKSAALANKWGAVRLHRFGERWGAGMQAFGKTIFSAALGEMQLTPSLDPDVSKRAAAAQQPGTPEAKALECMAIQYGMTKDFITNWGAQLPRRRIEEFARDVNQLVEELHALAESASAVLDASSDTAGPTLPPPPPPT